MLIGKFQFNCKQSLKLALVSAGTFLCLTPSLGAVEPTTSRYSVYEQFRNTAETTDFQQSASGTLLVQRGTGDICPDDNAAVNRYAETASYQLWICSSANNPNIPRYYVGDAKNGSGGITLRLASYSPNQYVAVNNNYRYVLNRNQLVVTRNGKVILRERVLRWD